MDKNKRDVMILIAIIFIGVNYAIYNYFIVNQLNNIQQVRNSYIEKQKKLQLLKDKRNNIGNKQKEIAELKKKVLDFDEKVPVKVDTPQLIYDFYTACKLYGVIGENILFQLTNESNNSNNQNQINSGNANNNEIDNFFTLTIDLKMVGDKEKVENFMKNLDRLTTRKLNVKSITILNMNVINENPADSIVISNKLSTEIVFYQYIQKGAKDNLKADYNYEFYNSEKEGFNSISDMFK